MCVQLTRLILNDRKDVTSGKNWFANVKKMRLTPSFIAFALWKLTAFQKVRISCKIYHFDWWCVFINCIIEQKWQTPKNCALISSLHVKHGLVAWAVNLTFEWLYMCELDIYPPKDCHYHVQSLDKHVAKPLSQYAHVNYHDDPGRLFGEVPSCYSMKTTFRS